MHMSTAWSKNGNRNWTTLDKEDFFSHGFRFAQLAISLSVSVFFQNLMWLTGMPYRALGSLNDAPELSNVPISVPFYLNSARKVGMTGTIACLLGYQSLWTGGLRSINRIKTEGTIFTGREAE